MPTPTTLWIGTRKGAFVARSKDRKTWKIEGPFHRGNEINHVVADPRDNKRVYATVNNGWFGSHLHASADGGKTWKVSEKGLELKGVPDQSIKRLWHIAPGHADEPGAVYLGVDPGALFRSGDWGETWEQVSSLTLHPTREKWAPGAGGMCLHSIQCLGKGRMVIAISAAGMFRSLDNGPRGNRATPAFARIFSLRNFPKSANVCTNCWRIPKTRRRSTSRTTAACIAAS